MADREAHAALVAGYEQLAEALAARRDELAQIDRARVAWYARPTVSTFHRIAAYSQGSMSPDTEGALAAVIQLLTWAPEGEVFLLSSPDVDRNSNA